MLFFIGFLFLYMFRGLRGSSWEVGIRWDWGWEKFLSAIEIKNGDGEQVVVLGWGLRSTPCLCQVL